MNQVEELVKALKNGSLKTCDILNKLDQIEISCDYSQRLGSPIKFTNENVFQEESDIDNDQRNSHEVDQVQQKCQIKSNNNSFVRKMSQISIVEKEKSEANYVGGPSQQSEFDEILTEESEEQSFKNYNVDFQNNKSCTSDDKKIASKSQKSTYISKMMQKLVQQESQTQSQEKEISQIFQERVSLIEKDEMNDQNDNLKTPEQQRLNLIPEAPQVLCINPLLLQSEEKKTSKQQKLCELKQKYEDDEMKECSFKPQLCKNSLKMAQGTEKLESKSEKIYRLKQMKLDNLRQIQAIKEHMEFQKHCTFKPQVNQKSIQMIEQRWNNINEDQDAHFQDPNSDGYYPYHKSPYQDELNFRPKINDYKKSSYKLDKYLNQDVIQRLTSPNSCDTFKSTMRSTFSCSNSRERINKRLIFETQKYQQKYSQNTVQQIHIVQDQTPTKTRQTFQITGTSQKDEEIQTLLCNDHFTQNYGMSKRRTLKKKAGFIYKNSLKKGKKSPELQQLYDENNENNEDVEMFISELDFDQRQNLMLKKRQLSNERSLSSQSRQLRQVSISKGSQKLLKNEDKMKFEDRMELQQKIKEEKLKLNEHNIYGSYTFKPQITEKAQNLQNKDEIEEKIKTRQQLKLQQLRKIKEDKENLEVLLISQGYKQSASSQKNSILSNLNDKVDSKLKMSNISESVKNVQEQLKQKYQKLKDERQRVQEDLEKQECTYFPKTNHQKQDRQEGAFKNNNKSKKLQMKPKSYSQLSQKQQL